MSRTKQDVDDVDYAQECQELPHPHVTSAPAWRENRRAKAHAIAMCKWVDNAPLLSVTTIRSKYRQTLSEHARRTRVCMLAGALTGSMWLYATAALVVAWNRAVTERGSLADLLPHVALLVGTLPFVTSLLLLYRHSLRQVGEFKARLDKMQHS